MYNMLFVGALSLTTMYIYKQSSTRIFCVNTYTCVHVCVCVRVHVCVCVRVRVCMTAEPARSTHSLVTLD